RFNVANALAAAAAAHALGLTLADIQMGLQTFHPTLGQNRGRTNLIEVDGVRVLLDDGHNVPALKALDELVRSLAAKRRIGVASAAGNRRDEDIQALGGQLARMHDLLFICETQPRGREFAEAAELLRTGALADGACRVELVLDEQEAVARALEEADPSDLLILLVDDVDAVIEQLRQWSSSGTPIIEV